MQNSFIARQPILDSKKSLFAYELLFRDGPNNCFPNIDPAVATGRLLSDHFLNIHNRVSEEKLSFVNFPYESLIQELPTILPTNGLVIEILETCQPSQQLLVAIKSMWDKGYRFALDDFIPHPDWQSFLPYISFIKFDISVTPIDEAHEVIKQLAATEICFLAERIETHEQFSNAQAAGFELFQGYFFSKPEMRQQKKLEPSVLTMVQLFQETTCSPLNYDKVEGIISKDLSLSYNLLSLVNSSPYIRSKINSFKQAIAYLGEEKLRKFIALLALTSVGSQKPQYLYRLSIQTARFCEQLAVTSSEPIAPGTAFLTGMFCYLESLLDKPIAEVLAELSIDDEIKDALLLHSGMLGALLRLTQSYEHAEWDQVNDCATMLGLSVDDIFNSYAEAIHWVSELFPSS